MVRFHPTDQVLVGFAEGLLPPNESLLVSAHCDMCPQCMAKVSGMVDVAADAVFEHEALTSNNIDNELGNMLDAIVSRPSSAPPKSPVSRSASLSIDGKTFSIPPSLQRFAGDVDSWSHLVGKLWQAPVAIGGKNLANFIYMEKGGGVPEHTHLGNEHTLVLDGRFSDGVNEYDTGDYISLDHKHTHSPIAMREEGCLVFSIIDEPLQFTSGWARLINPLSHLYFKVSTKP
ncbi:ChrR family anti-sigma-E factor [Glaciecola siphonariae]|uniref:ChrR family anti-sigma-E factor n=1 Tax=Glaciecola siphonariae TaxID=521012 RepID=A0ABV9LZP1_9ALTE